MSATMTVVWLTFFFISVLNALPVHDKLAQLNELYKPITEKDVVSWPMQLSLQKRICLSNTVNTVPRV